MKWLDRNLFLSPIYYSLCQDEKAFHKELKRLKIPAKNYPDFVNDGSHACTHFFEANENSNEACIICLSDSTDYTLPQIIGLLTHEIIHVWQAVKDNIGETHPSHEFEAYSVQFMVQEITLAFFDSDQGKAAVKRELKRQSSKS